MEHRTAGIAFAVFKLCHGIGGKEGLSGGGQLEGTGQLVAAAVIDGDGDILVAQGINLSLVDLRGNAALGLPTGTGMRAFPGEVHPVVDFHIAKGERSVGRKPIIIRNLGDIGIDPVVVIIPQLVIVVVIDQEHIVFSLGGLFGQLDVDIHPIGFVVDHFLVLRDQCITVDHQIGNRLTEGACIDTDVAGGRKASGHIIIAPVAVCLIIELQRIGVGRYRNGERHGSVALFTIEIVSGLHIVLVALVHGSHIEPDILLQRRRELQLAADGAFRLRQRDLQGLVAGNGDGFGRIFIGGQRTVTVEIHFLVHIRTGDGSLGIDLHKIAAAGHRKLCAHRLSAGSNLN